MKRIKLIIVSAAALLCVTAAVLQLCTPGLLWIATPRGKVTEGVLSEVSASEHISDVPEGEIRYLINNNVVFERDSKKGSLMFENPAACAYTLQFVIYEIVGDGAEENIFYTSPMLPPGTHLSGDKLAKRVKKGKYNCVYVARAYLDGEYIGERSGDLTLTVQH